MTKRELQFLIDGYAMRVAEGMGNKQEAVKFAHEMQRSIQLLLATKNEKTIEEAVMHTSDIVERFFASDNPLLEVMIRNFPTIAKELAEQIPQLDQQQ